MDVVEKGLENENPAVVEAGGLLATVAAEEAGVAEKAKRFGANDDVDDEAVVVAVVDNGPDAKLVSDGADALVPNENEVCLSDEILVDAAVVVVLAGVNDPNESVGAALDVAAVDVPNEKPVAGVDDDAVVAAAAGAPNDSVVPEVAPVVVVVEPKEKLVAGVDDDDVVVVVVVAEVLLLLDDVPKLGNGIVLFVVLEVTENGLETLVVAVVDDDTPNNGAALDVPNEPNIGALVTAAVGLITELSFVVTGTDTDDAVELDDVTGVPKEKLGGVVNRDGAVVTAGVMLTGVVSLVVVGNENVTVGAAVVGNVTETDGNDDAVPVVGASDVGVKLIVLMDEALVVTVVGAVEVTVADRSSATTSGMVLLIVDDVVGVVVAVGSNAVNRV